MAKEPGRSNPTCPLPRSRPRRDGQVEAARVFLQVGGCQVDHRPDHRAAVTRVDDRALDPVRALADGGLRQADQHRLGRDENETSTSTSTGVASIPTSVYEASWRA